MINLKTLLNVSVLLAACFSSVVIASSYDDDHKLHFRKHQENNIVQVGPRPYYLVDDMDESNLKKQLQKCTSKPTLKKTDFSIGHRGAAMQFPEHTKESYEAAARIGR